MDLLMDAKVGGLGEGLVTDGADVGLRLGVNASVSVEIGAIGEALAALLANIGFALEVDIHVILEGGRVRETLIAAGVGAREVALIVMDPHVFVEGSKTRVASLAVVARVNAFLDIDGSGRVGR